MRMQERISLVDDEFKLARIAYHAYGEVVDFKNYVGNPMPEFNDLPSVIKQAWWAAAERIYRYPTLEEE